MPTWRWQPRLAPPTHDKGRFICIFCFITYMLIIPLHLLKWSNSKTRFNVRQRVRGTFPAEPCEPIGAGSQRQMYRRHPLNLSLPLEAKARRCAGPRSTRRPPLLLASQPATAPWQTCVRRRVSLGQLALRAQQHVHQRQHILKHTGPLVFRVIVRIERSGQPAPFHLSE